MSSITEAETKNQSKDSKYKEELQMFLLQVKLQPIEFTSYGIYKIGYNLLAGVRKLLQVKFFF